MDYKSEDLPERTDELGLPQPTDKKKKKRAPTISAIRWVIIILVIAYFLLSSYRVPILMKLGQYLVVEHKAKKADLIVCLVGGDVERPLATVDVYRQALAPYVFRAQEQKPDGLDYLKRQVKDYPTDFDRFQLVMRGFDIPDNVILTSNEGVDSTIDEARLVRKVVLDRGFKSVIIVTSPIHSRRAWLTFKKVFEDDKVEIISLPSRYQLFNPQEWWKERKYAREVIIEYEKLIYYRFAYLL
ncbi:MAG: YdcF family protein [Deltaproteobacteria bacterium]|nr:MAG: YdcF family protein [Deltaproteobacteria bacterium]